MRKNFSIRFIAFLACIFSLLWLSGCATRVHDGPPHFYVDASKIPNAVPKHLPKSRYGNPSSYVVNGKRYYVLATSEGYSKRGIASWYGTKFNGKLTSTRHHYNMLAMTGASPVLPIPCFVRVTNLENGRSIIVKINDRGPFAPNRIIDLSYVAAKKLGYINKGTAMVQVTAIDVNNYNKPRLMAVSSVPVSHHPRLYLQLGAFRELAHAEVLKGRVEAYINKQVTINKGLLKHLPIYRVRIGPLLGVGESDHLQSELRRLGFGEAITVIG